MDILGINGYCTGRGLFPQGFGVLVDGNDNVPNYDREIMHNGGSPFETGGLRGRYIATGEVEFYEGPVMDGKRPGTAFIATASLADEALRPGFAGACIVVLNEPEPDRNHIRNILNGIVGSMVTDPQGALVKTFSETALAAGHSRNEIRVRVCAAMQAQGLRLIQPEAWKLRFVSAPEFTGKALLDQPVMETTKSAEQRQGLPPSVKEELADWMRLKLTSPDGARFVKALQEFRSRFDREPGS